MVVAGAGNGRVTCNLRYRGLEPDKEIVERQQ